MLSIIIIISIITDIHVIHMCIYIYRERERYVERERERDRDTHMNSVHYIQATPAAGELPGAQ